MKKTFLSTLLLLVVFLMPSCASVEIQNADLCSVAGLLSAGGICSRLTTTDTNDLSMNEFLDFLEAQNDRHCVPVPGFPICADDQSDQTKAVDLPARGASLVMDDKDAGEVFVELKEACRILGKHCSYKTQQILARLEGLRSESRMQARFRRPKPGPYDITRTK